MSNEQRVIEALRAAIESGVTKTRKEWAYEFNISYPRLCSIVNFRLLHKAIKPVRAEAPESGFLTVMSEARDGRQVVRVSTPILRAGKIKGRQVRYEAGDGFVMLRNVTV